MLLNMRSFLNRNKNFFLDNDSPNSENNLLKLNVSELSKGELLFIVLVGNDSKI